MPPYTSYEASKFTEIRDYLYSKTHGSEIDMKLIRLVDPIWFSEKEKPGIEFLASLVIDQKQCRDLSFIRSIDLNLCVQKILSWEMKIWSCLEIQILYSFYLSNSRLPNDIDEFMEFLDLYINTETVSTNEPVEKKGVDISSYLFIASSVSVASSVESNGECSLCFSTIDLTREYYVLSCGHKFHSTSEDCLEGTISRWFEKNNTCPLCRSIIQ